MPRGGKRARAGRKPKGLEHEHSMMRFLDDDGIEAFRVLRMDPEDRGRTFWGMINRALSVYAQRRKFEDPAEHIESAAARDHAPWSINQVLIRYQRLCGPMVSQKDMARFIGVHAATYNGYVNHAATIPKMVLGRAREVARDLCFGRDPDVNSLGKPVLWSMTGAREGLSGDKSPLAVSLDDWPVCLSHVQMWLIDKNPKGLAVDDFRGPTWISWKLLPAGDRDKVGHLLQWNEAFDAPRFETAVGPKEIVRLESDDPDRQRIEAFFKKQEPDRE